MIENYDDTYIIKPRWYTFLVTIILIIIWSTMVFMAGMSWRRPSCTMKSYYDLKTNHLVAVCVVENEKGTRITVVEDD